MTIRRIVTGHDEDGKAVVWKDNAPENQTRAVEKMTSTLLWVTDETPFDFTRDEEMADRKVGIAPPAGGTRFAIVDIEPDNPPFMHRTDTVDYVICLAGRVHMELDDAVEVEMRPGDLMVQRGTRHAWINKGNTTARLAVVIIDGKPKRTGSIALPGH